MNKNDIVNIVAGRTGLTQKDAKKVIDTILETVKSALSEGKRLEIRGLGSFQVRERAPRVGRDIATGQSIPVPSRRVPIFVPGKVLKKAVNEGKRP